SLLGMVLGRERQFILTPRGGLPLSSGNSIGYRFMRMTLGGARDAPLAPGWPETSVAERLPPRPDSRCAVCRAAQPCLWCHRPQRPGGLCPLDPLAPSGYDDDHPIRSL